MILTKMNTLRGILLLYHYIGKSSLSFNQFENIDDNHKIYIKKEGGFK